MGVVDLLETVEVDEQYRDRRRLAAGPLHGRVEHAHAAEAVVQPRQAVVGRLVHQARLRLLARRDVGEEDGQAVRRWIGAAFEPDAQRFVERLAARRLVRRHGAHVRVVERAPDGFRKGFPDILADQFIGLAARQRGTFGVDVREAPLAVEREAAVGNAFQDGAEVFACLPHGALGFDRFRHVFQEGHEAGDAVAVLAHGEQVHAAPEHAAVLAVVAQRRAADLARLDAAADVGDLGLGAVVALQEAAIAAAYLVEAVAGQLLERRIGIQDRIVVVDGVRDDDAGGAGLDDFLEEGRRLPLEIVGVFDVG